MYKDPLIFVVKIQMNFSVALVVILHTVNVVSGIAVFLDDIKPRLNDCNRSLHIATYRNIVERNILRAFGHPCWLHAGCC